MDKPESLLSFYRNQLGNPVLNREDQEPFRVFDFDDCLTETDVQYRRRDFFKIALMEGEHLYHYADKTMQVSGSTLMFFSPDVPYKFEVLSEQAGGMFCIFREQFFTDRYKGNIRDLPMFSLGCKPGYVLDNGQHKDVLQLFKKMKSEMQSDYAFKLDLVRNYVAEVIHYALKLQPSETLLQNIDANARITSIFKELLERQFPIETSNRRFKLRSPNDFAKHMSVHVNHLNRALKLTTGKTTTEHIAQRLADEAKVLLKHSNWNISEISYVLGFEDAANFNHFFKKHTAVSPSSFRS
ncbi:helix-turn-helix domain-containing protein [Niastella sp. OAS944]|uniref:helix-turn-helix domain-containing protein n=1 Tax=Niastella sp. OAS944 TaxID=2664089 RepID=UPI0034837F77|nr:AraC-like DNA-binding protein [Chitinophagaceae bacterium OAS944]